MKVTRKTLTKSVIPLLTGDRLQKALEDIPAYPLPKPIIEMTLGEFIEAMDETYYARFLRERYAYRALGMIKSYKEEMESIAKMMKRYSVSQTDDERQAAFGIIFPGTAERMLLDVQSRFGLCRLDKAPWPERLWQRSAEEVSVAEYLIVMKDHGSSAQYQRRYSKIQERNRKNNVRSSR